MKVFKVFDKTMFSITKLMIWLLGVSISLFVIIMFFLYATDWFWPEFNGSYNLGNNIYMIDWDGGGKIIVKGTNIKGNTCYGGERLIPRYENEYDSTANFAEYVVDAKSDSNWIIAKTDNKTNRQRKYYIVDKRDEIEKLNAAEIIENHTVSFTDSIEFSNICHNSGIRLKW